jgi:hypothetical protein
MTGSPKTTTLLVESNRDRALKLVLNGGATARKAVGRDD